MHTISKKLVKREKREISYERAKRYFGVASGTIKIWTRTKQGNSVSTVSMANQLVL